MGRNPQWEKRIEGRINWKSTKRVDLFIGPYWYDKNKDLIGPHKDAAVFEYKICRDDNKSNCREKIIADQKKLSGFTNAYQIVVTHNHSRANYNKIDKICGGRPLFHDSVTVETDLWGSGKETITFCIHMYKV